MGLLLFFLIYHTKYGKRQGGNLSTYDFSCFPGGNRITLAYLMRSVAFAGILFLSVYSTLLLIYRYASTDLHIWMLNIRLFNGEWFTAMP